jgi:3-deoxy-D-manno-octulosonic-acid transferase
VAAVVVTARGLLADLYLGADAAYVGGGFRSGRLHAVAEPAAVGVPSIVGPRWRGTADADRMVAAGGAVPVHTDCELADALAGFLTRPEAGVEAGLAARRVLGEGAAGRSAEAVLRVLPPA